MDVSNPDEHLPEFVLKTRPAQSCCDELGGRGPELAVDRETPETILIEQLNRQLLQGAVDKLPPDFREALLLCEVEEMSYREIAEILSIPIGTVMSRLTRARRAVRESLVGNLVLRPRPKGLSHRRSAREGLELRADESVN